MKILKHYIKKSERKILTFNNEAGIKKNVQKMLLKENLQQMKINKMIKTARIRNYFK